MRKITTFLKMMLLIAGIAGSTNAMGQGVFTSAAPGNWNAAGSWTLSSGTDADGIPDADDNVTIGSTHTITVDANAACNNLTLLGAGLGTRLAIGNFTLEVSGTLNGDNTSLSASLITSGTGRLKFIGSSRALFGSNWGGNPPSWRFEVALNSGQIGTASTNIKAGDIIISSGTFSLGELRPDKNSANTGTVTIEDGAILSISTRLSRTSDANIPFASLTINGNGKLIINGTSGNALPVVVGGFPVYTYSSGAQIEYQGGAQTIADISYPNLTITSGTKTWTVGAVGRTVGNISVNGTSLFSLGGGTPITVNGNISVNSGATISHGSSGNRFAASGAGRTFTLNGTARVTANETQTAGATSPFSYQYNGFTTYTFAPASWISFRMPATGSKTQGLDGISGFPFGNVEVFQNQTTENTWTFKTDFALIGNLAFPRTATGSMIVNFGSFTTKVGGAIQLNGSNANTQSSGRTYNMGTSTIELNGTSAQTTLGGTALPSSFTNLKLNNETGVTFANAITVSGTLTLAGNNNYTNLNNITGYTGLEYGATVAQTTGSEFGSTITNLIINNNNGVALGGSKTINGALTLTAGTLATGANTLTINGTTTGAGFINTGASGTLIYGGTAEQTLSASNLTSGAVNNLIINAGSKLTSSGTIAATNLTINSSDSGTGTFKDNGTLTAGTSTVQQYLINQSWYLTSPVNDGVNTANPVSPTNLSRIQSYIEGDGVGNTWSATGTTMVPYKGYITTVSDNPKTVVFTGKINSGSISIPLTRLATSNVNKNGFNLIGNPYTAYLDWVAVAAANASKMPTSTMWYRTKVSGNWDFTTVNGAGVATPANASSRIPPMQAFWVRALQVGNSTLDVTDAMVMHDNSTSNRLKAPAAANTELQLIRLQVSNATHTDELVIYTDSAAANTLDWYDAPKMAGDNPDKPEMSSLAGTESLAINAMHTLPLDTDIPLRFVTHKANLFALKMNEATNLPAGITVVLKDNGTEIDISSGNEHFFSSDVTTNANRFSLVFRSPGVVTRVNPEVANQLLVHNIANKQIALRYTENMLNTGKLTIYNAMGQLVQQLHMGNEHTVITVPASGVYLIHLVADGKQMSKRVIVK